MRDVDLALAEWTAAPLAIDPRVAESLRTALLLARDGDFAALERLSAVRPRAAPGDGAVAVIPIAGFLTQRSSLLSELFGGTSAESIARNVRTSAADPNVKRIVLDVNSPGGSTFGISQTAAAIYEARQSKPVSSVANSMMASAAYWLGSQAGKVYAAPGSVLGAIGVYGEHTDLSGALEKAGIKSTVVYSGDRKVDVHPTRPLGDRGRAELQRMVDQIHADFVGDVARGRGVSPARVRSGYGEGSSMHARDAVAAGLADGIATLEQVVGGKAGSLGGPAAARARWLELEALRHGDTRDAERRRWLELEMLR